MSHYLHHLPGRLRIRNRMFKGNKPLLGQVRHCFEGVPGIREITVSAITGSVLIAYDPDRIASEEILGILRDCEYIDFSRVRTLDSVIRGNTYKAGIFLGRQCLGMLVSHSLKPAGLSFLSALI